MQEVALQNTTDTPLRSSRRPAHKRMIRLWEDRTSDGCTTYVVIPQRVFKDESQFQAFCHGARNRINSILHKHLQKEGVLQERDLNGDLVLEYPSCTCTDKVKAALISVPRKNGGGKRNIDVLVISGKPD